MPQPWVVIPSDRLCENSLYALRARQPLCHRLGHPLFRAGVEVIGVGDDRDVTRARAVCFKGFRRPVYSRHHPGDDLELEY
jgi:hypothetical protein